MSVPTGALEQLHGGSAFGGHIVAPAAGEMIHEIVAAMTACATVRDIADAIHAFPTFAEGVKVAAGKWMNARPQWAAQEEQQKGGEYRRSHRSASCASTKGSARRR
jgi:Pyridine nucleotide-disulphide oxidoreductase, dimerisation domain